MKELGLNFSQKWNTDNTLTTEITMEDQVESNTLDIGYICIHFEMEYQRIVCVSCL